MLKPMFKLENSAPELDSLILLSELDYFHELEFDGGFIKLKFLPGINKKCIIKSGNK